MSIPDFHDYKRRHVVGYLLGVLRTDRSIEANCHNDGWLGPNTLGVEVTRPQLAKRCGLGNIDPQHGPHGKSSAIEAALEFPLPPAGTRIVTIRNDKDALGAIATLMLRAEGRERKIDKLLIHWIGVLDRMTYPQAAEEHRNLAEMFEKTPTNALNTIVKGGDKRFQHLPGKVRQVARILCGEMPQEEMRKIAALRKNGFHDFSYEMHGGKVAYILAPRQYEDARNWGNPRFEVTVVFDPERYTEAGGTQERWSLVRQPGKFDRQGFEAAINAAEAKARNLSLEKLGEESFEWGGNVNIISSPQGAGYGTALTKDIILDIVREHAESGVVS